MATLHGQRWLAPDGRTYTIVLSDYVFWWDVYVQFVAFRHDEDDGHSLSLVVEEWPSSESELPELFARARANHP
jgi:hypothetical protein